MATAERIRQNFVRRTLQTCAQFHGNLADGAHFSEQQTPTESKPARSKQSASACGSWLCTVCSSPNTVSAATCVACSRPRVPTWSKFPSCDAGVSPGMYIRVLASVINDAQNSELFPPQLREFCRKNEPNLEDLNKQADDGHKNVVVGIVIAVDFIIKAIGVIFALPPAAAAIKGRPKGQAVRDPQCGGGTVVSAVLPGKWVASGHLGSSPLTECPTSVVFTFGEFYRCANPMCFRLFRPQNADTRQLTEADRAEALAQARFTASKLRTLQKDKAKFLSVKDKKSVVQCAEQIVMLRGQQEELLRKGAPLEVWCPFCGEKSSS
eukprot:INCI435.1.p1 GENE.INCI435.1~~INCI435.1.p1  ORF type:complete len:356 (-),score=48.51 INCI435.1:2-970(-)